MMTSLARRARAALGVSLAAAAVAACGTGPPETSPVLQIRGAIYTDFNVDLPCAEQQAPPELSGVLLTFTDAGGTILAQTRTRGIESEPLEFGPGKTGWAHPGCRFFAPYTTPISPSARYGVAFTPVQRSLPPEGWFQGVDLLEAQTITHDELQAAGFVWSFEAPPAFVVP